MASADPDRNTRRPHTSASRPTIGEQHMIISPPTMPAAKPVDCGRCSVRTEYVGM